MRADVIGVDSHDPGDYCVILRVEDDRAVAVPVEARHAQSIRLGLDNTRFGRPLTHDLLIEVLTEMGGAVDSAEIYAYDEERDEFYARLKTESYRGGDRRDEIPYDCDPGDAVGVALKSSAPIRVSEDVVEEAPAPESETGW
ncbi:MAG: bifunctional nuclease family protein [Halobacteria archaeon]|nr:bifunctional nuclease family protein [Halobacteria archaeon]